MSDLEKRFDCLEARLDRIESESKQQPDHLTEKSISQTFRLLEEDRVLVESSSPIIEEMGRSDHNAQILRWAQRVDGGHWVVLDKQVVDDILEKFAQDRKDLYNM